MSIYKRKTTYWIQFTTPDGRRIQQSARTSDPIAAQELHDRLKAESWRIRQLGDRPRRKWQDAALQWVRDQAHKRSLETDKYHLRWLHQHLFDVYLDEITREKLAQIVKAKCETGVEAGTVNRMMALVRAILNKCEKEWEWIDRAPHVKMMKARTRRVRWLTREEAGRLMAELPDHLRSMALFSLATGLREANVVDLEWSQIDLKNHRAWIHHDQAKAERPIPVPLNDDALVVLHRERGKHPQFVFTYKGQPVTRANNHAWQKALKRAGIKDFRWHDLRHTWASWHVQAGTPLHVLQEMGGWADAQMVRRYAHLGSQHLAGYAGNSQVGVTNLLHETKSISGN